MANEVSGPVFILDSRDMAICGKCEVTSREANLESRSVGCEDKVAKEEVFMNDSKLPETQNKRNIKRMQINRPIREYFLN